MKKDLYRCSQEEIDKWYEDELNDIVRELNEARRKNV